MDLKVEKVSAYIQRNYNLHANFELFCPQAAVLASEKEVLQSAFSTIIKLYFVLHLYCAKRIRLTLSNFLFPTEFNSH